MDAKTQQQYAETFHGLQMASAVATSPDVEQDERIPLPVQVWCRG
jgi:hypothetical protein